MYCQVCGNNIMDGARFCEYCGVEIKMPGMNQTNSNKMSSFFYNPGDINKNIDSKSEKLPPLGNPVPPPIGNHGGIGAPTKGDIRDNNISYVGGSENNRTFDNYQSASMKGPSYADNITLSKAQLDAGNGKSFNIRSIYLVDFFIRLFSKENIPLLIYLIINVFIIGAICMVIFGLPPGWGLLCGLIGYVASIITALSPIGEFMLRIQMGCKKIKDPSVIERIRPIYEEVHANAKRIDPNISDDIRIYICKDKSENAFATGRRTICITEGLLARSDQEIKGIIGHEYGHLSHKDTDRILIVTIGNLFVEFFFILFEIAIIIGDGLMWFFSLFMDDGWIVRICSFIASVIMAGILHLFMRIWSALGVALCMKTNRDNEFLADRFSTRMGYGPFLSQFLATLDDEKPSGVIASLASSHPDNSSRISKIRENMTMTSIY